jgi:Leucine-rich repeat (LRR) protein
LRHLSFSRNQIRSIPSEIGELVMLKEFAVGFNLLQTLPEEIGRLSKLKSLWAAQNQFQKIPDEIGLLTQLKELCLDGNRLTSIPNALGNLVKLKRLSLYKNNLEIVITSSDCNSKYPICFDSQTHNLVFNILWSPLSHHNFGSDTKKCVKFLLMASLPQRPLQRLPKDVVLSILSFLSIQRRTLLQCLRERNVCSCSYSITEAQATTPMDG